RNRPVGGDCAAMRAAGRHLHECTGRRLGLTSAVTAPARKRAVAPDAARMVAARRHLRESVVRFARLTVGIISPACHGAVASYGTAVECADVQLHELAVRRRRLAIGIAAPARDRAVAAQRAAVSAARIDLREVSVSGRCGLAVVVVSRARKLAVGTHRAGEQIAGRDCNERLGRLRRLPERVVAPASNFSAAFDSAVVTTAHRDVGERNALRESVARNVSETHDPAVALTAAAMFVAERDLNEGSGRIPLVTAPALDAAVVLESAAVVAAGRYLNELAGRRRDCARVTTAPAYRRSIAAKAAGVIEPGRDLRESSVRRSHLAVVAVAPAGDGTIDSKSAGMRPAGCDLCERAGRHVAAALAPAFGGSVASQRADVSAADRNPRKTARRHIELPERVVSPALCLPVAAQHAVDRIETAHMQHGALLRSGGSVGVQCKRRARNGDPVHESRTNGKITSHRSPLRLEPGNDGLPRPTPPTHANIRLCTSNKRATATDAGAPASGQCVVSAV